MAGMTEVGPPVQQQRADRGRSAAIGRSDEDRRRAISSSSWRRPTRPTRGKIVLATVKGDVHDIGKNLVEIILSNNGYQVINLGIKVPPEDLIEALREHHPDAIGLSGLLVKSAHQMVITAAISKTTASTFRCWWAARRCRKNSPRRRSVPATARRRSTPRTP